MLRWTFLYINIFAQLCSMSLLCICYFLCQPYQGCISPTGVNLCLINVVYTASPWMPKTVGVFPGIPAVWVSLVRSLVSVLPKGGGIVLLLTFESSLSLLDVSPLSEMGCAKIFSWCVAYLHSLTSLFTEQKFLCWWSPIYEFFILWIVFLVSDLRKLCLSKVTKISPPSSRSFIILCFIFKSVLYLYSWSFEVLFLAYRYPFVPVQFVERIFFVVEN